MFIRDTLLIGGREVSVTSLATDIGFEVLVDGNPIMAAYGEVIIEERTATITRATALERWWTRLTGDLEFMELCEFSFSEELVA